MSLPTAKGPTKEEEEQLLGQFQSQPNCPPPYEAEAYPRVPRRRVLSRKLYSVPVLLALVLTIAVSCLCLLLERETKVRRGAQHAYPARLSHFEQSLEHCASLEKFPKRPDPQSRKTNPRWNSVRGQNATVILRNMTFFDGESILPEPMDIKFSKGLILELAPTSSKSIAADDAVEHNLHGRFVTPGLVDMHSHHSISVWPRTSSNEDDNEVHADTGPLTPMLRALDGMKAYDIGTRIIMSGGVTTSLVIPGSANIMGGEGTVVKNALKSGELGEYIMEEMLLEHGIPIEERHRYMKMACGENPSRVYHHTRMGNAWILREQLAKAKNLMSKQIEYCAAATRVSAASSVEKSRFVEQMGNFPSELKLESTVGMLRGRVAMQNHCYLPEDFETMLRISHEFGFRVRAFHHAIEAWQVPEMIKAYGDNITIATFAEFSLYKWEAYFPSLWAGKILNDHGIPVAYKSDHGGEETSAKYLMSQAGVGHSFHLPIEKALQSVTSIPAKAIDLDFRVGYARPGYDADLTVWDSHPLSIGATPLQVFIDGVPQLEHIKVKESMGTTFTDAATDAQPEEPKMRTVMEKEARESFCKTSKKPKQSFIINGIAKAFLDNHPQLTSSLEDAEGQNLTLVINQGSVTCLNTAEKCETFAVQVGSDPSMVKLNLSNGYLLPGLTALSFGLGMKEIATEPETGDGYTNPFLDGSNPDNLDYAKYGIQLEGKTFWRARMGGVTRAITPVNSLGGLVNGVSVGILTRAGKTLLDGGVFQSDVALHVTIDTESMISESTVSNAVKKLRKILVDGKGKHNGTTFGEVAEGKLPLVVNANNQYDIQQVILIKKDFPDVNIIIVGGAEAPLVAKELAEAQIPLILTATRPGPEEFRHRDAVVGPPLTPSVARYLSDAGVFYAIAIASAEGDYRIHALALEAAWTAKYAGLSDRKAVRLVSTNVEDIFGLKKSKDIVVWEGSPLQFGGSVVLSFEENDDTGKMEVAGCWPEEVDDE